MVDMTTNLKGCLQRYFWCIYIYLTKSQRLCMRLAHIKVGKFCGISFDFKVSIAWVLGSLSYTSESNNLQILDFSNKIQNISKNF